MSYESLCARKKIIVSSFVEPAKNRPFLRFAKGASEICQKCPLSIPLLENEILSVLIRSENKKSEFFSTQRSIFLIVVFACTL